MTTTNGRKQRITSLSDFIRCCHLMMSTSTLPITLTGSLPDLPDTATGLVHLGGGRWYDPAIRVVPL
jgi:hypothetical protein